ncbi:unnamed protein product [Caenorhabditis auriculariae]|uniref:Uncharacterized protein n=1 Tax=Caenorhabditis auriculariae TaxID=2777116 RepID=A0A8S1HE53_9PELO|nr:unnamed protein product [Caenorhabditis auriculariae]
MSDVEPSALSSVRPDCQPPSVPYNLTTVVEDEESEHVQVVHTLEITHAAAYTDASGRDPKHIIEDAIEENGDEFVPHYEYYEGADEFPVKQPQEQTVALIVAQPAKLHTMAVIPGICVRSFIDVVACTFSVLLIIFQDVVLDLYFYKMAEEYVWALFIAADSLVVCGLIISAVAAIKYNQKQMEEVCSVDGRIKYAFIAWLAYALLLSAKLIACFFIFYKELPPVPTDNNDKLFDDQTFKLALSLSVLIFVFIFETHHYTPLMSNRQVFISYFLVSICLDLVDNIYFLDLLWQAVKESWTLNYWIEVAILAVGCVNFVMPAFSLLKLRFARFPRYFLVSDKVWALIYVLIVNGPMLGLRIYLYYHLEVEQHGHRYDPSLFAVKNIAVIYLAIRELWTRLQYWRLKRRAVGSRGELTALPQIDEDN